MRVNVSYVQKCKTVAHVFQILLIFITGCITLAVFTKGGENGGPTKYYFALCFLSGPAIIYLVMVPMWSRAARFANAYAFVALDALYTLLWFVAFIAVAIWNTKGIKDGAKAKKLPDDADKNCTTFKYGPESKCELSKVTVGFGVVIFILFILTTAISSYYTVKFRKEGVLPYETNEVNPHHLGGDSSAKDNAWSTEIENHHEHDDDDDDDSDGRRTERGGNQEEDEYALLHSTETDEGRHPGRPLSWGEDRRGYSDTAYHGASSGGVQPPYAAYDDGPNALSPGGYEEYRKDPAERRESGFGGQGYSFGR